MVRASVLAAVALAAGSACTVFDSGDATNGAATRSADIPPPPLATAVPPGYRTRNVFRARLTGGRVADVVVTSAGPPTGPLNLHPATLQVLSWDALAKRWAVIFDAQKVVAPDSYGMPVTSNAGPGFRGYVDEDPKPILDPEADVMLGPVQFASLFPGGRKQLVFSGTLSYGGTGEPSLLVVVDLHGGEANVAYSWYGEGLVDWRVAGNTIKASSHYWTPLDSHCCPSRKYTFVVGERDGSLTAVQDQRPYLGVVVRQRVGPRPGPVRVIEVDDDSPAASAVRAGDVVLDVANAPASMRDDGPAAESIYNKLSALDAGDTAELVVSRGGREVRLRVRLASMLESGTLVLPDDDYAVNAL